MRTKEEKEIAEIIDSEIERCSTRIYPNICQIKDSESGRNKVFDMTLNVIAETGMSVRSALAQVESSL